ncbi:WDR53 [Symbiodinium natans]|uniref:WDR53 protein n=1 Tax=Symbiodinium natans TaxID=878477 RepID=A0A812IKU8_9DINO|nr:WDR53 [Symbiodinium natans]
MAGYAAAETPRLRRSHLRGHKDAVLCLCADASRLASGGADGSCRLWDLRCEGSRRSVRAAMVPGEVSSVAISAAREHMLLAAVGRTVYGFDLRSEKVVLQAADKTLPELAKDDINQVAIDAGGHLAAVAEDSGAVHLVDLNTWRVDKTLAGKNGHVNICSSVAWKPGREWTLASGGLDAAVVLWQRSGRGRKVQMQTDAEEESATSAGGAQLLNPPFVHSIAYSPDGETLAAGLGDGTVALLGPEQRLRGHLAAVAQVLYTPAGLVSAGNDRQVLLWSGPEPQLRWHHPEKVNWMAWHQNVLFVADLGHSITAYEGLL